MRAACTFYFQTQPAGSSSIVLKYYGRNGATFICVNKFHKCSCVNLIYWFSKQKIAFIRTIPAFQRGRSVQRKRKIEFTSASRNEIIKCYLPVMVSHIRSCYVLRSKFCRRVLKRCSVLVTTELQTVLEYIRSNYSFDMELTNKVLANHFEGYPIVFLLNFGNIWKIYLFILHLLR